jgi:murein DD-endopeptidase MepM/ murein hydrolase activator NlpD
MAAMAPQMFVYAANDESDLKNQIDRIEDQIKESEKKIADINKRKITVQKNVDDLMVEIGELDGQITNYNTKISLLDKSIEKLNKNIEENQKKIDKIESKIKKQEDEIAEIQDLLGQRIRASYMAGETSSLELLMGADSFETFLIRLELITRISEHDAKLISGIKEIIKELDESKKDLDIKKLDLEKEKSVLDKDKKSLDEAKSELDSKKRSLNSNMAMLNIRMRSLNSQSEMAKRTQQALEDQKDAFERRLDALLNGHTSTGTGSVSGGLIWPLPYKGTYITSGYGYRTLNGVTKFHYGIDISMPGAGSYNKTLVSSADGKVIFASNDGSFNGGYGNYLRIDHGNGVVTVYGHCYTVYVKTGQSVKQGQAVAILGNSGNSTGPHVHYEVRINGEKKNPLNYVTKPSDVYSKY